MLDIGVNFSLYICNEAGSDFSSFILILLFTSFLILVQGQNNLIRDEVERRIRALNKLIKENNLNKKLLATMHLIISIEKYINMDANINN